MTKDQLKIKILEQLDCDFTMSEIPDILCTMLRKLGPTENNIKAVSNMINGFIVAYNRTLNIDVDDMEDRIEELEESNGDFENKIDKIEESNSELEEEIEDLKSENVTLSLSEAGLTATIKELEKEIAELKEDCKQ